MKNLGCSSHHSGFVAKYKIAAAAPRIIPIIIQSDILRQKSDILCQKNITASPTLTLPINHKCVFCFAI